jgi:hypothetical protein
MSEPMSKFEIMIRELLSDKGNEFAYITHNPKRETDEQSITLTMSILSYLCAIMKCPPLHVRDITREGAPVAFVFSDSGANGIGQVVVGDMLQGSQYSKLINISEMVRVGTTLGWVSGGTVTRQTGMTGLGVNVSSGNGFIISTIDSMVYGVPWNATGMILTDNANNYIYTAPIYTSTGTYGAVTLAGSQPDLDEVVYLARVFTVSGTIDYIAPSIVDMNQHGDNLEDFNRLALGPIYVSGTTVTEDSIPFELDITPLKCGLDMLMR